MPSRISKIMEITPNINLARRSPRKPPPRIQNKIIIVIFKGFIDDVCERSSAGSRSLTKRID